MRLISILLMLTFSIMAYTQSANPKLEKAIQQFAKSYNDEDYAQIFSMYSSSMKTALPEKKTTDFLSGLKLQVGSMKTWEYSHISEGFSCYKTEFENHTLEVNLAVDDEGMLVGLLVNAYEVPMESQQSSSPKLEKAIQQFADSYNDEDYAQVFSMFSGSMKTALPENLSLIHI